MTSKQTIELCEAHRAVMVASDNFARAKSDTITFRKARDTDFYQEQFEKAASEYVEAIENFERLKAASSWR